MVKRKSRPPPLTAKRKSWAEQRHNKAVFKGNRLAHNVAIEKAYEKKISKVINDMAEKTERELKKIFSSKESKELFGEDASLASQVRILLNQLKRDSGLIFAASSKDITKTIFNRIDKASAFNLGSSIEKLSGGLSIKTDFIAGDVGEVFKASVSRNVSLIKSIHQDYFKEVEDLVYRSIAPGGNGLQDLAVLDKIKSKTVNRGVNIARDQTRKAYNNLNAERMKRVGLREFIWRHSGGGKDPRSHHKNILDGNIFSLEDLPVIEERTGERGIPGQAINCRCTMEPVVTFRQ